MLFITCAFDDNNNLHSLYIKDEYIEVNLIESEGGSYTSKMESTNLIFLIEYYNQHYSRSFNSAYIYSLIAGVVQIPKDEDKVKLKFRKSALYFVEHG